MNCLYKKPTGHESVKTLTNSTVWLSTVLKGVLIGVVGLAPVYQVAAADAATEQVILECGAANSDEVGLAGCVAAKLVQEEAALVLIEESWQRLLESEIYAQPEFVNDVTALAASDAEEQPGLPENAQAVDKPRVIAIVNNTALASGVSTEGNQVINIDEDGESVIATSGVTYDSSVELAERVGFLPALFRSYRDQQCALQATLFGIDRRQLYYQACLAAMAQAKSHQLTQHLSALRVALKSGTSFRGYYVKTERGAFFQACDRKTDWWLTGSVTGLAQLERRYLDIQTQALGNSDLLYAELRGNVLAPATEGPGADYSAALSLRSVGLLRPVTESDCVYNDGVRQGLQVAQESNSPNTNDTSGVSAATVDDFASAGFLYGYFNYWSSACSVTENTVCSAETEAEFASDGDWLLRVDRSLEGDWRVLLIPTTDNQLIEKQLTLQINGAEVSVGRTFPAPLSLAIGEGVLVAEGEIAREFILQLKLGRELRFQWFDDSDVMSELKFSLVGVSRALQYFDSPKS